MGALVSSARDPQARRIKSWQQLLDRQFRSCSAPPWTFWREGMDDPLQYAGREQLLSSQCRIPRLMFSHPEEDKPGIKQSCACYEDIAILSYLIFPLGNHLRIPIPLGTCPADASGTLDTMEISAVAGSSIMQCTQPWINVSSKTRFFFFFFCIKYGRLEIQSQFLCIPNRHFKAIFSTNFNFKSTQLNIPYRSSTDQNLLLSYFL